MSCCSAPLVIKPCDTLVSKCEIPIIDIGHMGSALLPQREAFKKVAAKLVRALSEKGLVLLVNHGIPEYKLKAAYSAFDDFCQLPEESREKFSCVSPGTHGYIKPEADQYSTEDKESRHEFIVSGSADALPDEDVPSFRVALDALTHDFKELSTLLLTALAIGMDQPPDFFLSKHKNILIENESTLKMMYYPPSPFVGSGSTRHGPYCDTGTFTLLAQDCAGGHEIQPPHGTRWGRVGHLPGTILVTTGNSLAKWTDQQLPSLNHRIVVPEQGGRGRHSIGFFVSPDKDAVIEPIDAKISVPTQEPVICRLQKKKRGVLTAYHNLQRRFRETYAS